VKGLVDIVSQRLKLDEEAKESNDFISFFGAYNANDVEGQVDKNKLNDFLLPKSEGFGL
jgi:hypothetical protein